LITRILILLITGILVNAGLFAQGALYQPVENTRSQGELVMKTLHNAHPRRIGEAVYRNGDWAVQIRGKWFCYADGRILPEEMRLEYEVYDRQPFYSYPAELGEWNAPTAVQVKQMQAASQLRRSKPITRSNHFLNELWNVHNRTESWERQKTINFLGRKINVHYAILEPLSLVEQRLNELAAGDKVVAAWKKNLTSITGWNYRNIAETATVSNHAYGIALDCIMPTEKGKETYWLWASERNPAWYAVPYTRRTTPPEAVIKAFESYGFIWGGKWSFYDTMHFEYRPEILLLNNIKLTGEW
jgi:hypothetical protein